MRPEVELNICIVVGQAAFEILNFFRTNDPDLVIISKHGKSDIYSFLMDYIANRIIKKATCPVLSSS